ncbi:MAG: methionyl-tRNA formyltransferase [Candidatus Izemoplasmatales bacterium]|nr:methionyl-tRNA formyltransferase [Candidatus Izemoplasmatales bacterium]
MKICFMGSMDFAVSILEGLHQKYGVDLVVTQPDKPVGRKQVLQGTPVKEKAVELGIELFQPLRIKKDYQRILSQEFDFIIVAAYGQIIPEVVLHHGKFQAINVHASLLPKYRGGSPMHKAIMAGDEETGVSIIYMEKALDSGFILSQTACKITETDNVKSLENKLSILGKDLLLKTLDLLLKNEIKAIPQDEGKVTYAYNFKKEELLIDFSKTAKELHNFVRGLNPWPVAYMMIQNKKLKVFKTEYINEDFSKNIGKVVEINKQGLHVQTAKGVITFKRVQLEGKTVMDIFAFMNGIGKTLFFEGQILK